MKRILLMLIFVVFTVCILTHSQISLFYALSGITLWYEKMLPSLVPFMILSGIMVRLHLTEGFSALLYPVIGKLYRVSKNGCYAMFIGFLCGFPMGAKTIADLMEQKMISESEGAYLLTFCNNIGPVYFCSFVLPLLHRRLLWPYVFGMYGIPLLYGLLLRYTLFRKYPAPLWRQGGLATGSEPVRTADLRAAHKTHAAHSDGLSVLTAIDDSIRSAMQSALGLCGYMILFNLFNLVPHLIFGEIPVRMAPLFEITGGLSLIGDKQPLYVLLLLPFGGLSCIAQTYHCIRNTSLSIASYTLHKIILTLLCAGYYLLWYLCVGNTFLH